MYVKKRTLALIGAGALALTGLGVGLGEAFIGPSIILTSPPASFDGIPITTDCSTDDTASFGGWLLTVQNGTPGNPTVVTLASDACYEINGTIWWRGPRDITIAGNGATIRQAEPNPSTPWVTVGGHNDPTVYPYCGSTDYEDSSYSATTTQPLTLVVEGGCDITVSNLTISGDHTAGGDPAPNSFYQPASFLTFYGTQRVLVDDVTETGPYGDWIEISGLHEAAAQDGNYPSTDVTVRDSTFTDAGRTGISETNGALRVLISKNTFTGAHLTLFDIEYDATVNKVIESDINITDNTIHGEDGKSGYGDLLSAQTGSELTDVAFTNNTLTGQAQIKMKLAPNATGGVSGSLLISGNTAQTGSSWPFNPVTVNGMTNVLVDNNSDPPDQSGTPFANLNASDPTNVACNNVNPVSGLIDATCPSTLPVVAPPAPAQLP